MNRNLYTTSAIAVIGLVALLMTLPAQAASCSAAKAAGSYSFTTNGVLLTTQGAVPVASVGGFSADANGNFSGQQTRSIGGQVAVETLTGSATVNRDCSASYTVDVFEAGTLVRTTTLAAQWDDNMNEEDGMFTSVVLKSSDTAVGSVVTLHAKRQK
jgi:hypothetical protein